jgi:hypothetical protein
LIPAWCSTPALVASFDTDGRRGAWRLIAAERGLDARWLADDVPAPFHDRMTNHAHLLTWAVVARLGDWFGSRSLHPLAKCIRGHGILSQKDRRHYGRRIRTDISGHARIETMIFLDELAHDRNAIAAGETPRAAGLTTCLPPGHRGR